MNHKTRNTKTETAANFACPRLNSGETRGFQTFRELSSTLGLGLEESSGRRSNFHTPRGMTLLLVVLILSALLSISIGIFNSVFTELQISGEMSDSFVALYAADQGVEKTFYDDRVADTVCPGGGACSPPSWTYGPNDPLLPAGACVKITFSRSSIGGGQTQTVIVSTGEYRCQNPSLSVKRALQTAYISP